MIQKETKPESRAPLQEEWRLELIDKLVAMRSSARYEGDLWNWSISDKEGYSGWHEPGAILLLTLDRRALAERAIDCAERFCRNVIVSWDTNPSPIEETDSVLWVTEDERRRIVAKLSLGAFREYLERVVRWIMHADDMLREAALSITHTANEDLLRLHRRTLTGQPGAANYWLEKKNLRDWITQQNDEFLAKELLPLKPRFRKKGDIDEDLALWRFVARKRDELKKAGVKHADREAYRLACDQFRIASYELYKKKIDRGRRAETALVNR